MVFLVGISHKCTVETYSKYVPATQKNKGIIVEKNKS